MTERQTELERCWGMEINVEKTKAIRISSQPSPRQIRKIKNNRRIWNISTLWVARLQIMQDVHVKLSPTLPWQKQQSTRILFTSTTDLNLRKKLILHLEHRLVWCCNLDTSECRSQTTGKLWNMVLEKISWTDHVRNAVSRSREGEEYPAYYKKEG